MQHLPTIPAHQHTINITKNHQFFPFSTSDINKENPPNISVDTMKNPDKDSIANFGNNDELYYLTQRTIEVAIVVITVNIRIITPVILQLLSKAGSSNLNVAQVHRNILYTMKLTKPILKIITLQQKKLYTITIINQRHIIFLCFHRSYKSPQKV